MNTGVRKQPETDAPTLMRDLHEICVDMYARWHSDQRSGKLITALDGIVENYDPRITRIRRALAVHDDLVAALEKLVHAADSESFPHDIIDVISRRKALSKAEGK